MFLINPFIYGAPISFSNLKSWSGDGVDEYLDLGRVTLLESTANLSISFWSKPVALANGKMDFSKYISNSNCFYGRMSLDGRYAVDISNGALGSVKTNTSKITAGVWQHIAIVFDGSLTGNTNRAKIYINGIDETINNSGTIPATTSTDTQSLYTGALNNNGTASNFNNTKQDEFSIFDYSLSQSEVTALYNSGCPNDLMSLAEAKRPEHYYRFDDITFPTVTDLGQTGGNNGTMTNAESSDIVTNTPCGFNNYSLAFDGIDEFVSIPSVSTFTSATNFSSSFWIKVGNTTVTQLWMNWKTASSTDVINMYYASGKLILQFRNGATNTQGAYTGSLDLNWTNVTFTYDGNGSTNADKLKLYTNGIERTMIYTGTIPSTSGSGTSAMSINSDSTLQTLCNIDEVSIFDYSLSASEVTDLYNSGCPNDLMSLAEAKRPEHYYRFENVTFPTVPDLGQTGTNNGTMTNMESGDIVTDTPC